MEILKSSEFETEKSLTEFIPQEESEEDINRLLQNLQGEKSLSTQKTYRYALIDFSKFFVLESNLSTPNSINQDFSKIITLFLGLPKIKGLRIVSNYMSYLRGEYSPKNSEKIKPQSTSTIYTKLVVLKTYVRQARAINELLPGKKEDWNLDDLKAHKVENKKVEGPSEKQFSKLLSYFLNLENSQNYIDLRNSLLFFVLAFTGLRISGALSINIEDIDFEDDRLKVFLKGNDRTKQEISIAGLLKEKISKFIEFDKRISGPLFINKDQIKESTSGNRLRRESAYRIIKDLCKKAGVENFHPHKFRHFVATEAKKAADDNIDLAKNMTDHKSSKVFEGYVDKRKNDQKILADKIAETWLKTNE